VSFGGETIFTAPNFAIAIPSSTMFTDPLECGVPCALLGLTGGGNPNLLAPVTYVQPLYNEVMGPLGVGPRVVPLTQLPDNASHINDDVHRNDVWLKDRWTPGNRWTVTAGLRWDQEIIGLPKNIAQANLFYTVNSTGTFIDVPGQSLGNNVVQPSYVSPRFATSYQTSPRDVFRLTYGSFMEFTPLSNIENIYQVEPSAQGCTIANGCFVPLPGYSANCVNGVDSVTHAPCNGINNLRQQIIEDLNKNNFAQYTPVLPQTAVSGDIAWEHDFGNGLQMRINPWFRRGYNYVVASTPLLFTLPDGTSVFGSPRESNAGININTGVDLAVDLDRPLRMGGIPARNVRQHACKLQQRLFPLC